MKGYPMLLSGRCRALISWPPLYACSIEARLAHLSPEAGQASTLAGEPIIARLTHAPGNNAPIGGLKVVAASGWFAARPSGTEHIYRIYA